MIDYNEAQEFEYKILDFCKSHKKVFLYGAGLYGRVFYDFLIFNQIHIEAFLTTYDEGELFGIPIVKYDDYKGRLDNECGVILSVNSDLQVDIINNNLFVCDIFVPEPLSYIYIDTKMHLKKEFFESPMCKKACEYNGERLRNILIVQIEVTFGDMIWSSAFIRELRKSFADSFIMMVINPIYKNLYEHCPYIDELVFYESDDLNSHITLDTVEKSKKFAEKYLSKEFDAVFLPRLLPMTSSDAWENVLLAIYSDAKFRFSHALYITNEDKFRCQLIRNLFSDIAMHRKANHEVYNDLELIRIIGLEPQKLNMELWIDDESDEFANNIIDKTKFVLAIGVVGSRNNRSWQPEKYGVLFNRLLDDLNSNIQILLLGGNDAIKSANIIQKITSNRCVDLTGKTTLTQSAAVISNSCLYVGSDTGLMHMASASGIKVIEISASNKSSPEYWGSSPTRTGPWLVQSIVLQPEKGLDDCKYMCNKMYSHCINQVSDDDVYNAINSIRQIRVK